MVEAPGIACPEPAEGNPGPMSSCFFSARQALICDSRLRAADLEGCGTAHEQVKCPSAGYPPGNRHAFEDGGNFVYRKR